MQKSEEITVESASLRLLRASEVEREFVPSAPLYRTLQWLREFIIEPHPDLGRKGPICPFAPISLQQDHIWMAQVAEENPSLERIAAIITEYRDLFLATEPVSGPNAIYKAFLVIFPTLAAKGSAGCAFVDTVQQRLKKYFVEMGLMIGEFHSANDSPGLRNPNFRPLRSPIPMLAIRHMVDSDLPFLVRKEYAADLRSSFLRSYLSRLSTTLSPAMFEQALNGLIVAEIEAWIDKAKAGEAPALATMFRARPVREEPAIRAP